jgi:hypothetical protein
MRNILPLEQGDLFLAGICFICYISRVLVPLPAYDESTPIPSSHTGIRILTTFIS